MENSFYKQPAEKFYINVNFSESLDENEIIDLPNCTISSKNISDDSDSTAEIIEPGSMSTADGKIFIRVNAGENDSKHKITFLVQTDKGNIYERDITMIVEDI